MALRVGTAYVEVVPKLAGNFDSDVSKSLGSSAEATGKKAGGVLGSSFGKAAAVVGGGALAAGATSFLKGSIDAARESAKVVAQTEQVVKSTGGAANISVGQVGKLATSISNITGVDDEAIQSAENLLLTFTNVRNETGKGRDVFDQATQAVTDMSAVQGDLAGNSILVGKALQDPIKGVSALQRVGVKLTDQQKEQVTAMVKAGDTVGAQRIILKELGTEFGGQAAAQATSADRLKVAWGNLQEQIGGKLIPVLDKVSSFLVEHQQLIGPLAILIGGALVVAFTAWAISAVSAAAATIAAAAPVLAIIAVIGLLVVGIYELVKHWSAVWDAIKSVASAAWEWIKGVFSAAWTWIQDAWDSFLGTIKDAWNAAWDFVKRIFQEIWPYLLGLLTGGFGLIVVEIVRHWDAIKGVFSAAIDFVKRIWSDGWNALTGIVSGAFDAVKAVVSGAWDAITGGVRRGVDGVKAVVNTIKDALVGAFRHEFNGIANIWNSTVGKLSFHIPSWVPGIGGKGFDVPNIPTMRAAGGPVRARSPYIVGEAGPELFVPGLSGSILPNAALAGLAGMGGGAPLVAGDLVVHESDDPARSWRDANRELRVAGYLAGWSN